ncbi:hypothetical protein E1301_Tti021515 [Triplophysa tibetana]|uniref:Pyrin domain-containing protein n=1 Tax=Triplophysa tibetana TaxID=1572043 RepID=A0A5A9N0P6_9TELE|nr:hypothetical protein E1301_Tti021515 [Triplophysa tibetana]
MMESVKEHLKNSLYDLRKDELKEFQWHLRNDYKFPASGLEEADVLDTVDKMVEPMSRRTTGGAPETVEASERRNRKHDCERTAGGHRFFPTAFVSRSARRPAAVPPPLYRRAACRFITASGTHL